MGILCGNVPRREISSEFSHQKKEKCTKVFSLHSTSRSTPESGRDWLLCCCVIVCVSRRVRLLWSYSSIISSMIVSLAQPSWALLVRCTPRGFMTSTCDLLQPRDISYSPCFSSHFYLSCVAPLCTAHGMHGLCSTDGTWVRPHSSFLLSFPQK